MSNRRRRPVTDRALRERDVAVPLAELEDFLTDRDRAVETYSTELGTSIAACDALASDLVPFDFGVLNDYLGACAGPRLLEHAVGVGDWGSASPSVFRLGNARGDRLVVHDEVSGEELEVLHTGEAMGTATNEWVLGRLVPDGEGGLVFASRPVTVGASAGRLLRHRIRAGGDWRARLGALHAAISAGELEPRPGWLAGAAALTHGGSLRDDGAWQATAEMPPAPRTRELMAEGMSRQTADHLSVLELALEVARGDLPGSVEMVAQHAAIALMWPEVREQAARRYVAPDQRAAWLQLGGCLPPHARGPFEALAVAASPGLAS